MKRILNVGCGKETYGTDFVDMLPQRKEVIKLNLDERKLPFEDNTFDEVYSRCFFEHLKNPNRCLKEMSRVLKKGGKIKIITDNAGFWAFHMPMSKTHYEEYTKGDKHFALYTNWHLINHFKEAGLKNIRTEYIMIKEKNPYMAVRAISRFLNLVGLKKMAYPNILIEGTKG